MKSFFLLSTFTGLLAASAVTVTSWPAVEVRTSAPLAVKVNGKPVEVMTLPAPTHCLKQNDAYPYHAVFFDADGEVEVEVAGAPMRDVRILPLSRGVKPQVVDARTLRFRATPPFTLAVEPTGRHHALVVSANVPETDAPKPDDPDVVYFGPGRHHRDEAIRLASNQTLYLAPGAYVEGAVSGRGTNITVRGRGILSGATWPWCQGPKGCGHMVNLSGSDITVKDVTLMSSFSWCLVLDGCTRATVDNVKILNGRVLNDDGIDVCSSRDVVIRNCFIRSQDDCITPKWWCENLLVEKCALWTDVANIFRIGYECKGPGTRYRNLTFRDCDILHQSIHKTPSTEYWAENAVFIQPANDQLFEDFTFENLRFDTPEAGDLFMTVRTFMVNDRWQHHKVAGHFKGLKVRDVAFPAPLPANTMGVRLESHDPVHGVADVAFENVTGCGPLVTAGEVKDVRIPAGAFLRRTPVTAWSKKGEAAHWQVDGDHLVHDATAGTVVADLPVATGGVVTARFTPVKGPEKPETPTTCGLRFAGPDGYWGLSFWRQPSAGGEGARRFEFEQSYKGRRFSHTGMTRLYARGADVAWTFGRTYLFSLRLTDRMVEVAVFDDRTGKEVFAEAWQFGDRPAVRVGRPTFYTWNGTSVDIRDVTWDREP